MKTPIHDALKAEFGERYTGLLDDARHALRQDIRAIMDEDFDAFDPTNAAGEYAEEMAHVAKLAVHLLRQRIGGDANLLSYVTTLRC